MDQELKQYLVEMEARMNARLEEMEARFLGKFMDVMVTHETRINAQEAFTRHLGDSLMARMSLLESRVLHLEQERPPQ